MSHHYEETNLHKKREESKFEIKDSGKRQDFPTGSVRDTNEGKGRFDLLPYYAIMEISKHFEKGSKKYNLNNWRLGQPLSRYFDSAQRHLAKLAMGFKDEPHLDAAIWNLLCFMETKKRIELGQLDANLNDFPYVNMEFNDSQKSS